MSKHDEFKESIGIVAVGSPASRVASQDGKHSTNLQDTVINLVRVLSGGNVLIPTFSYDEPNDRLNHNFINTYLAYDWENIQAYVNPEIYSKLKPPPRRGECEVPVSIETKDAFDVTASLATVRGNLTSGKSAYVWLEKEPNAEPASCFDNGPSKPNLGE